MPAAVNGSQQNHSLPSHRLVSNPAYNLHDGTQLMNNPAYRLTNDNAQLRNNPAYNFDNNSTEPYYSVIPEDSNATTVTS